MPGCDQCAGFTIPGDGTRREFQAKVDGAGFCRLTPHRQIRLFSNDSEEPVPNENLCSLNPTNCPTPGVYSVWVCPRCHGRCLQDLILALIINSFAGDEEQIISFC